MEVDVVSLSSEFPNDNPALHRGVRWICVDVTGPPQPEVAPAEAPPAVLVAHDEGPPLLELESEAHDAAPPSTEPVLAKLIDVDDVEVAPIVIEELEPIEANVEDVEVVEADAVEELAADAADERVPDAPEERELDLGEAIAALDVEAAPEPSPALEPSELPTDGEPLRPTFEEVTELAPPPNDSSALPPPPDDPFTVLVCTLADVAIQAGSPCVASILPGLLFDGRLPDTLDDEIAEALQGAGLWDGTSVAESFVATTCAWRAILRGTSDDFDACGAAMLDEWASDLLAKLLNAPAKAPNLRQELRSRGVAAFGLVEAAA